MGRSGLFLCMGLCRELPGQSIPDDFSAHDFDN